MNGSIDRSRTFSSGSWGPWPGLGQRCRTWRGISFLLMWLSMGMLPVVQAQTGVAGTAPITLQAGANDCGGQCITVEVFADVSGLSGVGGAVGLNAFALAFDLDRTDVFASARPGENPALAWGFLSTSRDRVDMTNRLVLVGVVADMTAPNQNYHLATVVLCGTPGDVQFSFVPAESSLGTRVVAGDGPGPVTPSAPAPFIATITEGFSLDFGTGISSWLLTAAEYDLVTPTGAIDVLDLAKLIDCGLP